MTTTWIIAADSSRARILQVTDRDGHLADIEAFVNPDARRHERDLTTDAEPRFNGHGGVGKPGTSHTSGPGNDREAKRKADYEIECSCASSPITCTRRAWRVATTACISWQRRSF